MKKEKHKAEDVETDTQSKGTNSQEIKSKVMSYSKTAKESISSDFSSGGWKSLIKNKYLMTLACVIVVLLVLFGNSGGNSTPKGTDSEVRATVIDIATREIRRQLTPLIYTKTTGIPVDLIGIEITYESLLEDIDDENNRKVAEAVDKAIEDMSLELTNIRVDDIQNEIKKSSSSADLMINGESSPIEYTAQRNSDGDIYVEVFGLN